MSETKKIVIIACNIVLFIAVLGLTAQARGEYPFKFAGVVDSIDDNMITLNDHPFFLHEALRVKSLSGLSLSRSDIQVGEQVGCNFIRTDSHDLIAVELYRLGANFDLEKFGLRESVLYADEPYDEDEDER